MDIGQPEIASAEAVAERFVVEPQEVEDGGVEVVDGLAVLHHPVAVLVGGAVDESLLEAAASQPEAEAEGGCGPGRPCPGRRASVRTRPRRGPGSRPAGPRALRSLISAATGWSTTRALALCPSTSFVCWSQGLLLMASPPPRTVVSSTKRTPRSTSLRATRHWRA